MIHVQRKTNALSRGKQEENRKFKVEEHQIILELKEKIRGLKYHINEYQNLNLTLKKELIKAKRESKPEWPQSCDELKEEANIPLKDKSEAIEDLKKTVKELQTRIRELELIQNQKEKELKKPNLLTRQLNNENQEAVQNCLKLGRKIEYWKMRNKELKEEIEGFRLEIGKLVEKGKESKEVQSNYRGAEKALQTSQSERMDMRSKLSLVKTRNQQLVDEIAMLKDDIEKIRSKTNDDDKLLEALISQQKTFQDLISRQKLIQKENYRRFIEDLKEVHNKHVTCIKAVSDVQEYMRNDDSLQQSLRDFTSLFMYAYEEDEVKSAITDETASSRTPGSENTQENQSVTTERSTPTGSENSPPTPTPEEPDPQLEEYKAERDRFRALFESVQEEAQRFVEITDTNNSRLNEWIGQLIQSKIQNAERGAEIRNLEETLTALEKLSTTLKRSRDKNPTNQMEELTIKNDVLSEENKFFEEMWQTIASSTIGFFETYLTVSDRSQKLYIDGLREFNKTSVLINNVEEVNKPETPAI